MNKLLDNLTVLQHKNAGHLKAVAELRTDAVSFNNAGGKAAHPRLQTEKLVEISFGQTEFDVIIAIRVAYMMNTREVVSVEIPLCRLIVRHVYENELRTAALDSGAAFGQIRHRLAAKSAAEMPQENQQNGGFAGNIEKCLARIDAHVA